MNKVITGMLVMLVMSAAFLGLSYSFYTIQRSLKYEPITAGTPVVAAISEAAEEEKEIERLNSTYTIRSIYGFDFYGGEEGEMRYKIVFEEISLDKVNNPYFSSRANDEFGSTLKVGQKLTVREIEENLIY